MAADQIDMYEQEEALHRLYDRKLTSPLPDYLNQSDSRPNDGKTASWGNYDVIIGGAGPAGLTMAVLLARYGLRTHGTLLCIERRLHPVPSGHADGLTCRTMEMFKELGLYEEVLKVGHEVAEMVVWAELPNTSRLQRVMRQGCSMHMTPCRVAPLVGCSQGQIERILEQELRSYAPHSLERGCEIIKVEIDEGESITHPVAVTIRNETGHTRVFRCQFLIGADGAHSVVRKSMGISMVGDLSDRVWGVIDFAAETDFPDIRRSGHIHSALGSVMNFPREQNNDGDWLSRFYVDMEGVEPGSLEAGFEASTRLTPGQILNRISCAFQPYNLQIKPGTKVEWFSEYSVRRCVAANYSKNDSQGLPRVFLVGDACHTHSPKIGQGMNVSMADSYNLAWKLAHVLLGIGSDSKRLLESYASERYPVGKQLVDIDEAWNLLEWDQKITKREANYQEARDELLRKISGFVTGYGIQYPEGYLINVIHHSNERCTLKPGCRMQHTAMTRFADGLLMDLHDEILPDGRWKLLAFATRDLSCENGRSAQAVRAIYEDLIPLFGPRILTTILIIPDLLDNADDGGTILTTSAEWLQLPSCVKRMAEMKTYVSQPAYDLYSISVHQGAVILLRPDGVISMIDDLYTAYVTSFLKNVVRAL
ncbi:FAD binding domain-containing protein [Aspergillus granulosus]|uniref:FAD binding domain-containing protein n=1 Tax=Aspergillus granulosus TaxID=176169 RepID=A0ABR4HMH5_9EURO